MLSHKQGGFMKFLLLLTCLLFSAEMEVDGNLKVTGTVDASGNAITNVGAPQTMTDAVNAGILQSALSDDGNYEHIIFWVHLIANGHQVQYSGYLRLDQDNFTYGASLNSMNDFNTEITTLMTAGWQLESINSGGGSTSGDGSGSWWIFKKLIEE